MSHAVFGEFLKKGAVWFLRHLQGRIAYALMPLYEPYCINTSNYHTTFQKTLQYEIIQLFQTFP